MPPIDRPFYNGDPTMGLVAPDVQPRASDFTYAQPDVPPAIALASAAASSVGQSLGSRARREASPPFDYAQPDTAPEAVLDAALVANVWPTLGDRPRSRREASPPFDYASLDTPTVTHRPNAEMRYTPADPRLARIVTMLEESIVLAIGKGRGPIDTATLRDIHSGLANGVSAVSVELAGETERLRGQLREAVSLADHLTAWAGVTLAVVDAAKVEAWRAEVAVTE